MPTSLKELKTEFSKSLLASYANVAIMEMRMYNSNDEQRPSYKEIMYMYCIYSIDKCTASDLVEMFSSSMALVSQTIISMEKKGFVTRTKDPDDKRRQILAISEEMMKKYSEEVDVIDEALKRMSTHHSIEDICEAAKTLNEVTDCMLRVLTEKQTNKF